MKQSPAADAEARGDGLVAALQTRPAGDDLHLWWLGQSGFAIGAGDALLVIDPYLSDSLTTKYANTAKPHVRIREKALEPRDLARAPVSVVAATHQHTDHLDPETLQPFFTACRAANRSVPLVAPEAWRALASERSGLEAREIVGMDDGTTTRAGGCEFTGVSSAHDRIDHDEHGHSRFLGYVIRCGRWAIYHGGDGLVYEGLAGRLRGFDLDVVLLPINGKVGNMSGADAAQLAKDADARLVVPCHYDMFTFNTADPQSDFAPACERVGQPYRVLTLGERLTLSR